jgi:HKD family nuclease
VKFEQLLARNVRGFWATSYSFGLKLFDQYLLRKLSQNTINAVVLADHGKVSEVWEHLPANEHYLARRVGSRYLLRGVQVPGGGAFHPKTYLLVRASDATLIVGSGNLTRDGIDGGREVFTSFSTEREGDLPSLRAWAAWMSRLVQAQDDALLRERWKALRDACPWILGSTDGSAFLVNDERTLLEQLTNRLPATVRELHVTAPFFDRHAQALDELISATAPGRVVLYAGAGMSVDGPSLAGVLGKASSVRLFSYEPRTFVHAKLIGAVGDEEQSTLLIGSPNLSRAALTLTSAAEHGNSETAVISHGSADQVRAVFQGSELELIERSLSSLDALEFEDDPPTATRPLVLRNATWLTDGHVAFNWQGSGGLPTDVSLVWDENTAGVPVNHTGVTSERIDDRDPLPLLCWLADAEGGAISNRAPIDDPVALHDALTGTDRKTTSRPSELEGLQMSPLVRLALWAHDKFIFDLDDTAAIRRANDAAAENAGDQDVSDFWDKYARAELEYDARTHSYRPLGAGRSGTAGPVDELLRELQTLLHASPDAPHPVLRVLTSAVQGTEEPSAGTPWTMDARQRVRAYNLLNRWCDAVADPRHALISPDAPVINYQTLLSVLLLAWVHEALDEDHLRRLLLKLLKAFIGAADGQGFLGRAEEELRVAALEHLDVFMVEVAAGLVAAALGPGTPWLEEIYDWQPVLARGIECGTILPGDWSGIVVGRITGEPMTSSDIDELLSRRLDFIDDETWCARLAAELELKRIELDLHRQATVGTSVSVYGPTDPLHDGRLLTVARRAIDHKKLTAVAVKCGDACTMIFEPGKHARALLSGSTLRSSGPTDAARLKKIEQQGGSWADVLDVAANAAA